VADDFAFGLYDLDWDVFSQHIEGAVRRVPAIGEAGVQSTVCGPESFTPDHKPLLGEVCLAFRTLSVPSPDLDCLSVCPSRDVMFFRTSLPRTLWLMVPKGCV
jgi:glycine/D-amino acid oxidase-like deaminating enzyme